MNTEYVDLKDKDSEYEKKILRAADIIRSGGLVAFPTETVYGLGCNGLDDDSIPKIYKAKGRPSDNPLILHIAEMSDLQRLTKGVGEIALKLAEEFWPGPLTMIFKKSNLVGNIVTGGLDTVGIRLPANKIARDLIRSSGRPIAAPSANVSGRPSPTEAEAVMEDLSGKIEMVLDGGRVNVGLESTIVDVTTEIPTILRPGFITKEMMEPIIGKVDIDSGIMRSSDERPRAPGMKYRHYAPKGRLTVFRGEFQKIISKIKEEAEIYSKNNKTLILSTDESKAFYGSLPNISLGSRKNEEDIAKNLFFGLRECDRMGAEIILSESFDNLGIGLAIMNRLYKAAGYSVIDV